MTTDEDVLLKEVDEDLEQQKLFERFKKYGPYLGVAVAALLVGVGAVQIQSAAKERAAAAAVTQYSAAMEEAAGNPAVAADALAQTAEQLTGGYAGLAGMRSAALFVATEDYDNALAALEQVYTDEALPTRFRDLARVRAAHILIDQNTPEALPLAKAVTTEAFLPFAQEVEAIVALRGNDPARAFAIFSALRDDPQSPPALVFRANLFAPMADAAQNGVALEPEASEAEDLLRSFTDQLEADGLLGGTPAPAEVAETEGDSGE